MTKHPVQKITITRANAGLRLDRWLKQQCPFEHYNILQKWIRTGQVRINGGRIKTHVVLEEGQEVRLPPTLINSEQMSSKPKVDTAWIAKIEQAILYQDDHVLVINKPAGLASQGGTNTKISLDQIVQALPLDDAGNFKMTHRLDKDTSGVIVFAKSARDSAWVTGQFKERRVQKVYWAVVVGVPAQREGSIHLPISKLPSKRGEKMTVDLENGLDACTHYKVIASHQGLSWVEFKPETGRTHQIRVHSLSLGCPILGDGKYGGKTAHPSSGRFLLHLHARTLSLILPNQMKKAFTAPLPIDMTQSYQRLGFHV